MVLGCEAAPGHRQGLPGRPPRGQMVRNAHPTQPCRPTGLSGPAQNLRSPEKWVSLCLKLGTVLWKNHHGPHGGSLLLLKGRGVCWHLRGLGCCSCREAGEMPACLLIAPCTRWQEAARGTAETLWERWQVGLPGEALAQEDCMGSLLGGCGQGARAPLAGGK